MDPNRKTLKKVQGHAIAVPLHFLIVRGGPVEPPARVDLADQRHHFPHGLDGLFDVFVCVDG